MRIITVAMPEKYLEAIDQLVMEEKFMTKRDTIRLAVRDLFMSELQNRDLSFTGYHNTNLSRNPEPDKKSLPF